jgi:hypothetical protein
MTNRRTITRDEIVQNPQYQDRVETVQNTVSLNSLKGLETVRYRSVDESIALIIRAVAKSDRPITRTEICKAIKRAKSPRMIALIEWLVEDGKLKREHQIRANGMVVYYYSLG